MPRVELKTLHSAGGYLTFGSASKGDSIEIDPFVVGHLAGVVHECLHHLLRIPIAMFDDGLEEAIVDRLTVEFVQYIWKSPRLTARWRTLLRERLRSL